MPIVEWLGISSEELLQGVVERQAITQASAVKLCRKIEVLDEQLRSAFRSYWETNRVEHDVTILNYTIASLIRDRSMTPISAILTLDWIIRKPKEACEAMSRGWDTLVT